MNHPAVRNIIYSLICFYAGILVCIALVPIGVVWNGGLSYYGTIGKTILPYALAIIGAGFFGIKAARTVGDFGHGYVRPALYVQSWLLLGILITPYTGGRWVHVVHDTFGTIIFCVQLGLTGWLARWYLRTWQAYVLWGLELAAAIVSAIYLTPKYGHLTEAQIAFQLAYGVLLAYELSRLLPPYAEPDKHKSEEIPRPSA